MNFIHPSVSQSHKDMILGLLLYYMNDYMREKLMLEAPAAYNAVCGTEIVVVHLTSTGERVVPRTVRVGEKVVTIMSNTKQGQIVNLAGYHWRVSEVGRELPSHKGVFEITLEKIGEGTLTAQEIAELESDGL